MVKAKTYFLPCYVSKLPFIIWMNMSRTESKFNVKVFIEYTQICLDPAGKNSIAGFVQGDFLHVVSSSANESQLICFTSFDISEVDSQKVVEYTTHSYFMNDFRDPYSGKKIENDLNIRDIVVYSVYTVYTSENPYDRVHQVIVS